MLKREEITRSLEGRTGEEKRQILQDLLGVRWQENVGPCKWWFAKVFTYCLSSELEEELNDFLWLVNLLAPWFRVCFQHEDTVFLGCICPCGHKQTVVYYSITPNI